MTAPIPPGGTVGVDPDGPAGDNSFIDPEPNPEGPPQTVVIPDEPAPSTSSRARRPRKRSQPRR
jgi:hypothetical protein